MKNIDRLGRLALLDLKLSPEAREAIRALKNLIEGDPVKFTTNNFNALPVEDVKAFFTKELVDSGYLKAMQLESFLCCAFELKRPVPERIGFLKTISKRKAITIFYKFYLIVKEQGMKKEYCALLGENFKGFTTASVTNNFR